MYNNYIDVCALADQKNLDAIGHIIRAVLKKYNLSHLIHKCPYSVSDHQLAYLAGNNFCILGIDQYCKHNIWWRHVANNAFRKIPNHLKILRKLCQPRYSNCNSLFLNYVITKTSLLIFVTFSCQVILALKDCVTYLCMLRYETLEFISFKKTNSLYNTKWNISPFVGRRK